MKQKHIIRKQVFDIQLSSKEGAPAIQDEISRAYWSTVIPVLDKVCSDLSQGEQVIRIDKLEIDLGSIAQAHLTEEIPGRVEKLLEDALIKEIQDVKNNQPHSSADDSSFTGAKSSNHGTEIKPSEISELEQFVHYLKHGSLPWWSSSKAPFSPLISLGQLIKDSPEQLKVQLEQVLKYLPVRKRFVYQFPDSTIEDTIQLFQQEKTAKLIRSMYEDVQTIHGEHALGKATHIQMRQSLWDTAIQYVLKRPVEHFSTNDKTTLLSSLVEGIVQINNKDLPKKEATAEVIAKVHQAKQVVQKKRIKLKTPDMTALLDTIISTSESIGQAEKNNLLGKDSSDTYLGVDEEETDKLNEPEFEKPQFNEEGLPASKEEVDEQIKAVNTKADDSITEAPIVDQQDFEKSSERQQAPHTKNAKQEKPDSDDARPVKEEKIGSELKSENQLKNEEVDIPNQEIDLDRSIEDEESLTSLKHNKATPIPGLEEQQDKINQKPAAKQNLPDDSQIEEVHKDKRSHADEKDDVSGTIGRKQKPKDEGLSAERLVKEGLQRDQHDDGKEVDGFDEDQNAIDKVQQTTDKEKDGLGEDQTVVHKDQRSTGKEEDAISKDQVSSQQGRDGDTGEELKKAEAVSSIDKDEAFSQEEGVSGEEPLGKKAAHDIDREQEPSHARGDEYNEEEAEKVDKRRYFEQEQEYLRQRAFDQSLEAVESNINNAGLVILWPYLAPLFTGLELVKDNAFISEEAAHRAVYILQYMITGDEEAEEHELILNKLLCGLEVTEPIPLSFDLSELEKEECRDLLQLIADRWTALKSTSVETIQATFMRKEGILTREDKGWVLKVERTTLDILMDHLPWGISIVRLPWNEEIIYTEW